MVMGGRDTAAYLDDVELVSLTGGPDVPDCLNVRPLPALRERPAGVGLIQPGN